MTIRGVVARVLYAWHPVVRVEQYTVTGTGTRWSVRGTAVAVNAFYLRQTPLVFVAPTKYGDWRWPIRRIEIQQRMLTADLDPPQLEAGPR